MNLPFLEGNLVGLFNNTGKKTRVDIELKIHNTVIGDTKGGYDAFFTATPFMKLNTINQPAWHHLVFLFSLCYDK